MKPTDDALPSPTPAAEPLGEILGNLHGRMLHVSRLATIGEMAAGIAHELNQPLTAIALYAQACDRLIAGPNLDLSEIQESLREIAAEALKAGEIIGRLRGLARNHRMERAPADMTALIEQAMALVRSDARARDVRLHLDLAPNLPAIVVDREHIQHVILNLTRNALEALETTPMGTRDLWIRSSIAMGGDIEVAVCDSGPGPDPTVIERIFDPFFSTKESGTGLGLPISHTIARAHGGSLGYRPNDPSGACFYIRLPCQQVA